MKVVIVTNASLLGCGLGHLQVVSRESRDGTWPNSGQRTPSPKPEVEAKENVTDKNQKRNRNYKRGIRSEIATNRTKTKHLMKQSEERREYRKQKSETSQGRLAEAGHQSQTTCKATPGHGFQRRET